MAKLTFDINELARLAQHAVDAPSHTFGYDVLFDPQFHKGGELVEKDGWPDKDNIDRSKLKPALLLVKDQGVYMLSNGEPGLPHEADQHVVYAAESNPKTMPFDAWYNAARTIVGGDDTVMTLFGWPEDVLKAQAEGATEIQIEVSETRLGRCTSCTRSRSGQDKGRIDLASRVRAEARGAESALAAPQAGATRAGRALRRRGGCRNPGTSRAAHCVP